MDGVLLVAELGETELRVVGEDDGVHVDGQREFQKPGSVTADLRQAVLLHVESLTVVGQYVLSEDSAGRPARCR
jgi:hypothetical protein